MVARNLKVLPLPSAFDEHDKATTNVHGVGAGTVAKVADIATDTNLSAAAQDAVTKRHTQGTDTTLGTQTSDLNMGGKAITNVGNVDGVDVSGLAISSIIFVIDGGGSAIATGQKGHIEVPFACTISQVTLLADQDGAIKIDIWKDTYGNFPPTNDDTITGGHEPEITATGKKSQDSTLTDWTKSISAGDILAFNVDSCTTITRVMIAIKVSR